MTTPNTAATDDANDTATDTVKVVPRLQIPTPTTLNCESLIYVLRDELGRRWLGTDDITVQPGGVMGHLLPEQGVEEGSVEAAGDHVTFLIPRTGPTGFDGAGVAYLFPSGLLDALISQQHQRPRPAPLEPPASRV